jgi:Domain of unknown function DUF11
MVGVLVSPVIPLPAHAGRGVAYSATGQLEMTIETVPLEAIAIGDSVTIAGDALDFGRDPSAGMNVVVTLPPTLRITSTSMGVAYDVCTTSDQTVVCAGQFASPRAGDAVFEIEAVAVGAGIDQEITADFAALSTSGNVSTTIDVVDGTTTSDLAVRANNGDLQLDTPFTLEAYVENRGTVPLENVEVDVTFDESLLYLEILELELGGVGCGSDGGQWTCSIGTLDPRSLVRIKLIGFPIGLAGQSFLSVKATSSTAEDQPDPSPNEVTDTFEVLLGRSNLGISIDPPRAAILTGVSNWTVNLTNDGPDPAYGTQFTVTIPEGHEFLSIASPWDTQSTQCRPSGRAVTCISAPFVRFDPSTTATPVAVTTRAFAASVEALATATISSPSFDRDLTNNVVSAPFPTATRGPVQWASSLSVQTARLPVGEASTVTSRWLNQGPSAASDVVATIEAPDGWVLSNPRMDGFGQCTVIGRVASCRVPTIGQNSLASMTATTTATSESVDGDIVARITQNEEQVGDTVKAVAVVAIVSTMDVWLTPSECATLTTIADRWRYGSMGGAIRAWMPLIANYIGSEAVAAGADPGETCIVSIDLSTNDLRLLNTLSGQLATTPDEAAAGVGRFLVALYHYFFG